ncbi:MAG TPA: hypothetical protein ENJ54_01125 [Chloroflexi bacterium]|nr:hypothetical protein [Chloroflexota bacterium]
MPGGRKTKLNDDRIKAICKYVEEGLTYETAARLAGIDPATLHRWRREGAQAKRGLKKKLVEELEVANAKAQRKLVRQVKKEKGGAKWILERRWPKDWGTRLDVQFEGQPLQRVVLDLSQVPEEQLRRFLATAFAEVQK